MTHVVKVTGGVVLKQITRNGSKFYQVQDPNNPSVQFIIPYDRRYYRGLTVNFEGEVVDVGHKYIRINPFSTTFYEEPNA